MQSLEVINYMDAKEIAGHLSDEWLFYNST